MSALCPFIHDTAMNLLSIVQSRCLRAVMIRQEVAVSGNKRARRGPGASTQPSAKRRRSRGDARGMIFGTKEQGRIERWAGRRRRLKGGGGTKANWPAYMWKRHSQWRQTDKPAVGKRENKEKLQSVIVGDLINVTNMQLLYLFMPNTRVRS